MSGPAAALWTPGHPRRRPGAKPLVVVGPDGSHATSPFYAGPEHPLCAWDECDFRAKEKFHLIEPDHEKKANVWFYFCSEYHKKLHVTGHRHYKTINPGTRSGRFL